MNGLFTWQEPFRPYLEKKVIISVVRGNHELQIRAKMIDPRKVNHGGNPPKFGKMKILKEDGKEMLLRADKIKQIQEVNQ